MLVGRHDFLSSPRFSRTDRRRLTWLAWDHPNMPWNGNTLYLAELDDAGASSASYERSWRSGGLIFQPEWDGNGGLFFVSDQTGYWNLYRWELPTGTRPLCPRPADFGVPQWVFGLSTYCVLPDGDRSAA